MPGEMKIEGLTASELVTLGPCVKCGKKLLEGARGALVPFYVVTVATGITDPNAIRRQVGLGMQIGVELASIMGPDEDLAKVLPGVRFMLHQDCAFQAHDLLDFVETTNDRLKEAANTEAKRSA